MFFVTFYDTKSCILTQKLYKLLLLNYILIIQNYFSYPIHFIFLFFSQKTSNPVFFDNFYFIEKNTKKIRDMNRMHFFLPYFSFSFFLFFFCQCRTFQSLFNHNVLMFHLIYTLFTWFIGHFLCRFDIIS